MPELISPSAHVHASWLDAVAEPGYEPRWADDVDVEQLTDARAFAAYCESQRAQALEGTARLTGWVPATHLWWVDGSEFLGRLSIRHRLTPWLLDYSGHIGYDVRPSARRRGHATAMLRAALPWCRDLGIDPVLVTCDADNLASRKVIENNGGKFEDQRDVKLRYWIATSVPRVAGRATVASS
jgi:predicted acetyltransferase